MPSSNQMVGDAISSTHLTFSGTYDSDNVPESQHFPIGTMIVVNEPDGSNTLYVNDGNRWVVLGSTVTSLEYVATTGDYNDLMNTPPIEYINIDVCTNNLNNERFHNIINQVLSDNGL